ncbi:SpoIIE family protein phosphatase [candidate division KSB1 bacterium]|nr:SpoIIE family protein phosphatase [candidate division KSB1 bacterium]
MIEKNKNIPHILVVDDDDLNRKFFLSILGRKKFFVDDANSGEAALKKIAENNYHLVISDLHMYKIGGLQVLEAAKKKDPFTQVLILTGFGSIPSAVLAMQKGAFEYLPKPVDQDAMLAKVETALERRRIEILVRDQEKKINEFNTMIQRDIALAKRVQDSLIVPSFENDFCAVSVEYLPMIGIGGDFVDIYDDGNSLFLTIIDITGHGITAALLVNRVCSEIRRLVSNRLTPRMVLYELNRFFCRSFPKTGMFLTAMCVKIEYSSHSLYHAGSAHPASLLYNVQKNSLIRLNSDNVIIGFEDTGPESFTEQRHDFFTGDRIFMYTDGLVEAENPQEKPFGLKGFLNSLKKHISQSIDKCSQSVIQDVKNYMAGDMHDDILLLIAEQK